MATMRNTILCLAALLAAATTAAAQGYPVRAVKLVVGFAPGGAADFVARSFQDALSKELGQQVVVENRAGAGSSIAAEYVAKSPPDGYTFLIASPSSILVNPIISPKPGFDPQARPCAGQPRDLLAAGGRRARRASASPRCAS